MLSTAEQTIPFLYIAGVFNETKPAFLWCYHARRATGQPFFVRFYFYFCGCPFARFTFEQEAIDMGDSQGQETETNDAPEVLHAPLEIENQFLMWKLIFLEFETPRGPEREDDVAHGGDTATVVLLRAATEAL